MENKRIDELDTFRAFAAIMVVLYHYTTRYEELIGHIQAYPININFGYMAVSMFFILSGFLTAKSIKNENSIIRFLWNRFIRLWPCYIVAMIITSITIYFGGESFSDKIPSIKQFLINLTMIPNYLGVRPIDGAYWTLAIELIFYLMASVTIKFKNKKKIKYFYWAWLVISIFSNIMLQFGDFKVFRIIKNLLITNYSQLFIMGILLYNLYEKKDNKKYDIYACMIFCFINNFIALGVNYTIFCFIEITLLYLIVVKKVLKMPKWLISKPIKFMAGISYPLYLIHQQFGYVIINKIEMIGLTNEIFVIIPIIISIIIAYLMNKYIEKPIILKLKNNKLITKLTNLGGKKCNT